MAIISININIYSLLTHKLTCVTVLLTPLIRNISNSLFLLDNYFAHLTWESRRILRRNTLVELVSWRRSLYGGSLFPPLDGARSNTLERKRSHQIKAVIQSNVESCWDFKQNKSVHVSDQGCSEGKDFCICRLLAEWVVLSSCSTGVCRCWRRRSGTTEQLSAVNSWLSAQRWREWKRDSYVQWERLCLSTVHSHKRWICAWFSSNI